MARVYHGLDVNSDFGGAYPWTSERLEVSPGVAMAYIDVGPADKTKPAPLTFVCLHGNPTWSFLYRRFITALAPMYRVIAVDHIGFGRSDKPADPAYYTLDRHIENLTTVLDHLNVERAVPVMQDWGGPIGMGWATAHPDQVAGAVVLDTWAFVVDPPLALPWLFKFLVLGKGGWKRATQSNVFTELFLIRGGRRKLSKLEQDAYRAPHPTPAERIGIARFPQLIPQTADTGHEAWATMKRIEDRLPRLRVKPAVICWALKDRAFEKSTLQRWQRTFSKIDGPHLLPNAAHFLQEDAADEIIPRVLHWAENVSAGDVSPPPPLQHHVERENSRGTHGRVSASAPEPSSHVGARHAAPCNPHDSREPVLRG